MPYIVKEFRPVRDLDRKQFKSVEEAQMDLDIQSGLTPDSIFEIIETDDSGTERGPVNSPRTQIKELRAKLTVVAGELSGILSSMKSETDADQIDKEKLAKYLGQAESWMEDFKNRLR